MPHGADPRWTAITFEQLVEENAGLYTEVENTLTAREVSQRLGRTEPPSKADYVRDALTRPVTAFHYPPGTAASTAASLGPQYPSSLSYVILGAALEQIAHASFYEVLDDLVLAQLPMVTGNATQTGPLSMRAQVANTVVRHPREAFYDGGAAAQGPSVLVPQIQDSLLPPAYGGGDFWLEGVDSAYGLSASADALATMMDSFRLDGTLRALPDGYECFASDPTLPGSFAGAYWWDDGLTSIAVFANNSTNDPNMLTSIGWLLAFAMSQITTSMWP